VGRGAPYRTYLLVARPAARQAKFFTLQAKCGGSSVTFPKTHMITFGIWFLCQQIEFLLDCVESILASTISQFIETHQSALDVSAAKT
jgi:hypothetical protein